MWVITHVVKIRLLKMLEIQEFDGMNMDGDKCKIDLI